MEYEIRDLNGNLVVDTDDIDYFVNREGKVIQVDSTCPGDTIIREVENAKPVLHLAYQDIIKGELVGAIKNFEDQMRIRNDVHVTYDLGISINKQKEGEFSHTATLVLSAKEMGRKRDIVKKGIRFRHGDQLKEENAWKSNLYRQLIWEIVAVALSFEDGTNSLRKKIAIDKKFEKIDDINTGIPEGKLLFAILYELAVSQKKTVEELIAEAVESRKRVYKE